MSEEPYRHLMCALLSSRVSSPRESPAYYCQVDDHASAGCPDCRDHVFSKWQRASSRSLRFHPVISRRLVDPARVLRKVSLSEVPRTHSPHCPTRREELSEVTGFPVVRLKIWFDVSSKMIDSVTKSFLATSDYVSPLEDASPKAGFLLPEKPGSGNSAPAHAIPPGSRTHSMRPVISNRMAQGPGREYRAEARGRKLVIGSRATHLKSFCVCFSQ